jgi:hypothetical protein
MRWKLALGALTAFLALRAGAQVNVELVLEDEYFLPRQPLVAAVRITNLSGQTLALGKDSHWLTFAIESKDGILVSVEGDPPVAGEFEVESATVATKRVDLAPYFILSHPGRYQVTATVRIPQWDRELTTPSKRFVVNPGRRLWEEAVGVSSATDPQAPPDERKYVLQVGHHAKQTLLYVYVTDKTESRVFRMLPVGPFYSVTRPEPQLDRESNLHLLFQTGARTFSYCVIDPGGQLTTRQTHEYSGTRPRLKPDAAGKVTVAGGKRRLHSTDLPPAATAPSPPPTEPEAPTP